MLIQDVLKSLTKRSKSRRQRRLAHLNQLSEPLEMRALLTGNVQVSLSASTAQFLGDSGSNELEVAVEDGSIVIRGLNGTTINNETTGFTLVTGATAFVGNLAGSLGGGDDVLTIGAGISLTGNVTLSGASGADTFRVLGGSLHGDLTVIGGAGTTSVIADAVTIHGNLQIRGAGSTLVGISNSTVHGRLDVWTGPGNSPDSIVVQDTTVNGPTLILTGRGDDDVVIQRSTLNGTLVMYTGAGNDVVYVDSSSVAKFALIATQRGNDSLQVLNSSSFSRWLIFAGGAGKDVASIATDTATHHVAKLSQKAKYFDANLISSRITDSATGAIARANALLTSAVPILTLSTNVATVSESGGANAATLTVTRTGNTTTAIEVTLTSSNTSKATVPSTVTIPAGITSVNVAVAAVSDNVPDSDAIVTITATATGFAPVTHTITVTNDDAGTLTVTPNTLTVPENAVTGTLEYTINRTAADLTQPLTVNLVSALPGRLTVPGTVTIPANASSATFDGFPVSNGLVDGNTDVVVTASAVGYSDSTALVSVVNTDVATLKISPATSAILESDVAGTTFYTVSRNTIDNLQPLSVNFTTANAARLGVPANGTVTIPIGQTSAAFEVTPVVNNTADGNVDVQLTATASNFVAAAWTVTVIDVDVATPPARLTANLSVFTVAENAPANASELTVTRSNSNTTQDLLVNLFYSDASRVSGPATITIPAGLTSAKVPVSPIDNLAVDGNLEEDITATASGFATSQVTLTIIDNEIATLSVTPASTTVSEAAGTLAGTISTSLVSSAPIVVSLTYSDNTVLTGPAIVVIPAGALSVPVTFSVVNGTVQDQSIVAGISAAAVGAVPGTRQVTVTDSDTNTLTAVATASDAVQSNGTIITRSSTTQVTGTTTAGSTITVDSDGDGVFDNGTTVAASDGTYSVDVGLLHTSTNHGANRLVIKSVSGTNSADSVVNVHMAVGTVVHFDTNLGAYDVELLDTEAQSTVDNFLSYVNTGAYEDMIVHRVNTGNFGIIQSGGFKVSSGQISPVVTQPPIINDFKPGNSNVAGTLAMALPGDINGGTSQWFINTINNGAAFDPGKYTVFGRVIGDGLAVATQISNLAKTNLNGIYNNSALSEVPLSAFDPAKTPLTGQISTTVANTVITGTGTLFTSELTVGQSIQIGGQFTAYFVASIESDTSLTLTSTVPFTAQLLNGVKDVVPDDADFVIFSSIGTILDTI